MKYEGVDNITLAVMGCIVNGPDESRRAKIGILDDYVALKYAART